MLLAVLAAAARGPLIGAIAQRRSRLSYTVITLALAQMVHFHCLQAPWTQDEDGLQSVPRGQLFGRIDPSNGTNLCYVMRVVTVLDFAAIWRIVNSPCGAILLATKPNARSRLAMRSGAAGLALS